MCSPRHTSLGILVRERTQLTLTIRVVFGAEDMDPDVTSRSAISVENEPLSVDRSFNLP